MEVLNGLILKVALNLLKQAKNKLSIKMKKHINIKLNSKML